MSIATPIIDTKQMSITEMVRLIMPAAHERRGRHVSTSDEYPTTVTNIPRGTGKHRAEPIGIALYLDNSDREPRHRALPDSLFALISEQ